MMFHIALTQIFTLINHFLFTYVLIPFFIQILNVMHHHLVEDNEVVVVHFSFPLTDIYPS